MGKADDPAPIGCVLPKLMTLGVLSKRRSCGGNGFSKKTGRALFV